MDSLSHAPNHALSRKASTLLFCLIASLVILRASFGFGLLPDWDSFKHIAAARWVLEHNMNPFPGHVAFGHPPIFYMILAAGMAVPSASPWGLHALIAVTGVGAAYYTLRLGTQFGGMACGILASFLMLLSPLFTAELETFNAELLCAACLAAALVYYFERRWGAYVVAAAILVLTKETGVAAILVLAVFHLATRYERTHLIKIMLPLVVFGFWTLGNRVIHGWWLLPRAGRSLHEIMLHDMIASGSSAAPQLFWWTFGACGMWILTGSAILIAGWQRWRCATGPSGHAVFFVALIFVHLAALAVYSGPGWYALPRWTVDVAPLTFCLLSRPIATVMQGRKLLPPLLITLFGTAWTIGPPFISPQERDELNLNYRDRIEVNRQMAAYIENNHPSAQILTWWPLTHILSDPTLGYVRSSLNVGSINIDRAGFHWVDRETSAISDAAFHIDDLADTELVVLGDMIASTTITERILSRLPLTRLKSFRVGQMAAGVFALEHKHVEPPERGF